MFRQFIKLRVKSLGTGWIYCFFVLNGTEIFNRRGVFPPLTLSLSGHKSPGQRGQFVHSNQNDTLNAVNNDFSGPPLRG